MSAPDYTEPAAELSRLLWSAREHLDMAADLIAARSTAATQQCREVRDRIDTYRAGRGWPSDGFGGERSEQIALPPPDGHADLDAAQPGETAPVWHLHGSVVDHLGPWVRAASPSAPMEIAGHDVADVDLDGMEHDLLALLAAVRASRAGGAR